MKKLSILPLLSILAIAGCGGDDDGPALNGPSETADFQVRCHIAGLGTDLLIPMSATVAMTEDLADGVPATAFVDASATLDQGLADTIVSLGMGDTVTLATMDGVLGVVGADATTLDLEVASVPSTVDFDANDDLTGDEVILPYDTASLPVTSDGSATMSFSFDAMGVSLTDVPLLGSLDIVVPSPNTRCTDAAVDCAPGDTCYGADTSVDPDVQGWCATLPPGGLAVFCEMPSDGSNVVTFPVPTPAP